MFTKVVEETLLKGGQSNKWYQNLFVKANIKILWKRRNPTTTRNMRMAYDLPGMLAIFINGFASVPMMYDISCTHHLVCYA